MTIEHYRTNSIEECNAAIPELLSKAIYIPNSRKYLFLDHSHLVDILCYGDDTYLITADGDNYAQLLQNITKLQLDGKPATDAKGVILQILIPPNDNFSMSEVRDVQKLFYRFHEDNIIWGVQMLDSLEMRRLIVILTI
ncbi:MAG: hypothetical protein IKA19_02150 [Muribaculaceae bacterium]|nr:hypothetical protein [Muribaculaceae bacterium]